MISIYTGSVGSGKSYHATELGFQWVRSGKYVIANFPMIFGKSKRERKMAERWLFNDEITVEWLIAISIEKGFYGKESQCLIILDEAGVIFNSRDWQAKTRMPWIKFMSQSRKFGYDIILIAQSDRMIDKQMRGLVEYEVRHLKANNSFFFRFLSVFKVTLFLYVYRWYHTKLKSNLRMSTYKKRIARRYDTMRTFNIDDLIAYLEKLYKGKVVPANVATFIDAQRKMLDERIEEKKKENKKTEKKSKKIVFSVDRPMTK